MKYYIGLTILACLVLSIRAELPWCDSGADCKEDECCTGSSFNRHCQKLSEDGTPCQAQNKYNSYSYGCPCKEGLVCSPINYCQPAW